jgi:glycosyltransferase involved in cell wall biosynthesis
LVFFTLYEGFGMPLLEAFAMDTPVICSNVTSLPEVGGEAVLCCDPHDIPMMAELMTQIVSDEDSRAELVQRGRVQLRSFSWENSARNLYKALQVARSDEPEKQIVHQTTSEGGNSFPLVSIVTPSFNQGKFLRRTIESVLNQTYPNIEYFVIDGGSTDESMDILKSYGDRFKWVSESDRGQSHAINKGFARSNGEIRGYLNSDDVMEPDAIEKVVTYFLDNPECDLVYGRAYYIDENDEISGMYNTDDYSFSRLMQDCCICQPAAFWRRSAAERVGRFDENLKMALDYDYWLRLDRSGLKIHHIPDILARSRLYAETKTLSARETAYREAFLVCQRHGGYVDLNYFYGLWNHLIWEKATGLPNRLLRWRNSDILMARIHHKTYHLVQKLKGFYKPGLFRQSGSTLKRKAVHYTKKYLDFIRPLVRKYRSSIYRVDRSIPVFGYWTDNWLAPVVQFYIKEKYPGQPLYLEGIPVVDMEVQIKVERKMVEHKQISGGQYIRIEIPAQEGERITFTFSKPVFDPSYRYVSFLVQGTNLFTEEDPIS